MAVGSTARRHSAQLVHYMRIGVTFNDIGIANGVGKQVLPAGAVIIGTDVVVTQAFNAASTNVLTVGTNGTTANNIVASGDVDESAVALTQNIKPTSAALGPLAADAQVYVKYTQTGTAASAGAAEIIIKYVPDNDL